jgi:hypothetical protein
MYNDNNSIKITYLTVIGTLRPGTDLFQELDGFLMNCGRGTKMAFLR